MGFLRNIGPLELFVILLVVLLLFGRRLPELGSGLGKAINNFKRSFKDGEAEPGNGKGETGPDSKQ